MNTVPCEFWNEDLGMLSAAVATSITCFVMITFMVVVIVSPVSGEILNKNHKTEKAIVKINDLFCYECDTMQHGERCSNLSSGNRTWLRQKCGEELRTCMVKRNSYTTSTENSTSVLQLWSLQRKCTNRCEPGCIVIGERTKLYACTSCCETYLCNVGRGEADSILLQHNSILSVSFLVVLLAASGIPDLSLLNCLAW